MWFVSLHLHFPTSWLCRAMLGVGVVFVPVVLLGGQTCRMCGVRDAQIMWADQTRASSEMLSVYHTCIDFADTTSCHEVRAACNRNLSHLSQLLWS